MSLSKTIGFISGINECFNFFQWAKSAMSCVHSRWSNTQDQKLQGELLQLQSSLQCLRDTLPAKYDLIDRAEWRSHERRVAELLPNLKDAVYNVDDFLDEFRWYEQKVALEGNASQSPFMDFFDSVIQGSFNKVNDVIKRLYNISSQLEKMGLHEVPRRFDNSLRPETSSFLNEREIFGRDNELQQVMELLGVPKNGTDARSKRRRKNNDESTSTSRCNQESIPVLPIVGIGGVGKTTMAQHILHDPRVISHFDMIIWICVSDDFDVKRLTKEAIQSYSKKESTADHLDSLQHALSEKVRDKTLLIILDDMWDDALRESGRCWKRFCAPFSNVLAQGSIMLVTTRSLEVAHEVKTMEPVRLEGLKDDIFWNFFKICTFGSSDSSDYPELERIGRNIVPKLKGSPLAAKTLGRLLRTSLDIAHWNNILQSELWELRQHNTEILPALRLSYLYLPFHLKRCFSFCALYPKDHLFEKAGLAEIWIAEGFVEPEGSIPILDIGCQYFEELVNRSFFQKVHGNYVIHDLLHDMAQLVSKHECFILKDKDDFEKVPSSVRHLFILPSTNFDCNLLLSLCKHKKLRTLLCHRSLQDKTLACVMDRWCTELQHMRVIVCPYTKELPASIGKLKHLRYLKISGDCPFKSLPQEFCHLYNLQIFSATKCRLENLPSDFNKLRNLRRFDSCAFRCDPKFQTHFDAINGQEVGAILQNVNHICGCLTIDNIGLIRKDIAAKAALKNKKYLNMMTLKWSSMGQQVQKLTEVLQVVIPPTSLSYLNLTGCPGEFLPTWFHPSNLPMLTSLELIACHGFVTIPISSMSQSIDPNEIPRVLTENNTGRPGIFSSLNHIIIESCNKLSNLDQFLQPAYLPAIKTIKITKCRQLVELPTDRLGEFHCLEELEVSHCPNLNDPQSLSIPTLKKLKLINSWNLLGDIECCSLTSLVFSLWHVTSIPLHVWSSSFPALQKLQISDSGITGESQSSVLTSLSVPGEYSSIRTFSCLTDLKISSCNNLTTLDHLLSPEHQPAVEKIYVALCSSLRTLPCELLKDFSVLKDLKICFCPSLKWHRRLVLPSTLQRLSLTRCGDLSPCVPSCLENLASLVSLEITFCSIVAYIPASLWRGNLSSLRDLHIRGCEDLVSIGGAGAIAEINKVKIEGCLKLKEIEQPMSRARL
uniref:Uncharacterized protein n=1 Tax=Oryza barthii TaxID=65489 RepID=A0A0D3F3P1_9ORYZ